MSSSSELMGIVPKIGSSCSSTTRWSSPKSSGEVPASTASSQRATAAMSSGFAFARTSRTALTNVARAASMPASTWERSIPSALRSGEMSPAAAGRGFGLASCGIAGTLGATIGTGPATSEDREPDRPPT